MSSNIHTRYHLCTPDVGFIEAFPKKDEALQAAAKYAKKHDCTVVVSDSMSRPIRMWQVPSPNNAMHKWMQTGEMPQ